MTGASTSEKGVTRQPPVDLVLFDMDGLLLDTEGAYTIAQQRILDRFNRTFTWELKAKMMGRQAREAAQVLLDELGLKPEEITAEQFLSEREALLRDVFPQSPLMPGAERLVRHLHACRIPIAVATGSNRAAFDLKTSALHPEFFALFDLVVTGDMVARAKPDPEIFLKAAEGLAARRTGGGDQAQGQGDGQATGDQDPAPDASAGRKRDGDMSRVLVFEDAPNGVEAALAGGMRVVLVPYPGFPEELCRCGATQVLKSLEDFVPEEWGLPPYPAPPSPPPQ